MCDPSGVGSWGDGNSLLIRLNLSEVYCEILSEVFLRNFSQVIVRISTRFVRISIGRYLTAF